MTDGGGGMGAGAAVDRAVAPLGTVEGPPALAGLFAITGVAAITVDTPAEEVARRLEALRSRLAVARGMAVECLHAAGWPEPEQFVTRALAEPGTPEAAEPERPPEPLAVRFPALHAWRREVRAGRRTVHRYDALCRAATWEAAALEAERDELPETAAARMRRAREVLAETDGAPRQERAA